MKTITKKVLKCLGDGRYQEVTYEVTRYGRKVISKGPVTTK